MRRQKEHTKKVYCIRYHLHNKESANGTENGAGESTLRISKTNKANTREGNTKNEAQRSGTQSACKVLQCTAADGFPQIGRSTYMGVCAGVQHVVIDDDKKQEQRQTTMQGRQT